MIFIGIAVVLPLLYLVGLAMVWTSKFWTLGDKLFATIVPLAPAGAALVTTLDFSDSIRIGVISAVVCVPVALALAFRMGQLHSAD